MLIRHGLILQGIGITSVIRPGSIPQGITRLTTRLTAAGTIATAAINGT